MLHMLRKKRVKSIIEKESQKVKSRVASPAFYAPILS
nr:MAG TPA: hypothetical protein [Caudoviricetes sp.]DAY67809.1 MAG TPA: hypothetical protein [Caudoviricetes sp.]